MIDDAVARIIDAGTPPAIALASLAVIDALSDRAAHGHAKTSLLAVAAGGAAPALRDQAALLARSLADDEGTDAGARADEALGVVDALAILGPFRDTGGGLEAHDGPEAPGASFRDARATYSWGAYEVGWRTVPRPFATADGVPLDLFIHPRKESCSWVASRVTFDADQPIVVRVASTGQVRLVFDGVELGRDLSVHPGLRFDRLEARLRASAGAHVVAAKVCSGALDDDGEVRLRITDENGAWPARRGRHGRPRRIDGPGAPRRARGAAPGHPPRQGPRRRPARTAPTRPARVRRPAHLRRRRRPAQPPGAGALPALVDGSTDADRIALVAWISSSGANRSAWYHRALQGAADDPRTTAFVQRRLVELHRDAGLADWAEAALHGAGVDAKTDAEAALLTARVELALGTDALRARALSRLKTAATAPDPPDAVLSDLLRTASDVAPEVASAAAEALVARGRPTRRSSSSSARRVPRRSPARPSGRSRAAWTRLTMRWPSPPRSARRARTKPPAASTSGSRWAPNRGAVWAGLARETGGVEADPAREPAPSLRAG